MRFTDIFIKRPVLAVSISLLIVLLGLQALSKMSVRQYPKMTNTQINVTTSYYGAGADLIQGFITQPLQQAIAQADNIDFITSSSKMGLSTISVTMKLNTDPNGALADILSRVNSVKSQLPSDAQDPTIALSTGATTSILYLSFSGEELTAPQIADYLNRVISPQLFTVNGIAKVTLYGGSNYALRIWLDPLKLANYGLTSSNVISILQANNYQSSAGQINGIYTVINTNVQTQVADVDGLSNLVLSTANNTIVRLKDVAEVSMATSHDTVRALINGKSGVLLAIDATPTANPLDIARSVKDLLPTIERNLPSSMKMQLVYDSTISIDASINEVISTIVEASLIVLLVITLFLGSIRAVIIPIVTIPLSMIGVIMIMHACDFSINLMTLLAMVLAIGLVVDDAIVVVENVDRHIKEGKKPFEAAIIGTREIAVPVISMTITLAAVYSPIALMGGLTGSLFKEFALTLAGSVFISGIIALTLSPMMCSKLLKSNQTPNILERTVNSSLEKITSVYSKMLDTMLHNRTPIVFSAIVIFISLPLFIKYTSSELAPYEDIGAFIMQGTSPNSANLDFIQDAMTKIQKKADSIEGITSIMSFIGAPNANQSMSVIVLDEFDKRPSTTQLISSLKEKVSDNPNVSPAIVQMPALPGASSGLPMQFVVMTPNNFEQLYSVSQQVSEQIDQSGLFVYKDIDLAYDSGTLYLTVDRDKAGAYGITMSSIGQTLSAFIADGYINRVAIDGRSYEVIPQLARKDRLNPESLSLYYVKSASGKMIPLSSIVSFEVKAEPRQLNQMSQQNAVTFSLALSPSVSMGEAVNFFENEVVPKLPIGYTHDYKGESRQFTTEGSSLATTFGLAILIIFLVLACQFESMRDPIVILIAVPLAISGALMMLALGIATMNIYTEVGIITLVGLISKHGILICEVAKEHQLKDGMSRLEAVKLAATIRLRPILMTTAAMVAGLLPLLVATGSGAQSRFSIGLVIVAGLSIGTLFTLFVLPIIYSFVGQKHKPLPDTESI